VQEPCPVHLLESVSEVGAEPAHLGRLDRSLVQSPFQIHPFDELHDEVDPRVVGVAGVDTGVEERDERVVVQRGDDLGLRLLEAQLRVGLRPVVEELDGDPALEERVLRDVHGGHRAAADDVAEPVAAPEVCSRSGRRSVSGPDVGELVRGSGGGR
jgi:hypothetical protein